MSCPRLEAFVSFLWTPSPPLPSYPLPLLQYDCDFFWEDECLPDDRSETLLDAKGAAPGAKIAVLDLGSSEGLDQVLGGAMWEASAGTGARVHSGSWGYPDDPCRVDEASVSFDTWAFEVREGGGGGVVAQLNLA